MGKFCLWNLKSWALEYEIHLEDSRILLRLEARIQVPLAKTGIKSLKFGIQNPRLSRTPLHGTNVSVTQVCLYPGSQKKKAACHLLLVIRLKTLSESCSIVGEQTQLKLDSLSFLSLINKLQSHPAFGVGSGLRFPDVTQTLSTAFTQFLFPSFMPRIGWANRPKAPRGFAIHVSLLQ